jgi:hypothetical protein
MSKEWEWNDSDNGKPNYLEKNLSWCQFVHHKSDMAYPENEPRLLQ